MLLPYYHLTKDARHMRDPTWNGLRISGVWSGRNEMLQRFQMLQSQHARECVCVCVLLAYVCVCVYVVQL